MFFVVRRHVRWLSSNRAAKALTTPLPQGRRTTAAKGANPFPPVQSTPQATQKTALFGHKNSSQNAKPDLATLDHSLQLAEPELAKRSHSHHLGTGEFLSDVGVIFDGSKGSPARQDEGRDGAQPDGNTSTIPTMIKKSTAMRKEGQPTQHRGSLRAIPDKSLQEKPVQSTPNSKTKMKKSAEKEPAIKKSTKSKTAKTCLFADLCVSTHSRLIGRCGLTQFLNLQELEKPPGMVFDLATLTLSVEHDFPSRLPYVTDATHHTVKPWIAKAFGQRAEAWRKVDATDASRVGSSDKTQNITRKNHFGNTFGFTSFFLAVANMQAKKGGKQPCVVRWGVDLAPNLPSRRLGHLDGMVPKDADIFTETHGETPKLSSIFFAINAPFHQAQTTWTALAWQQEDDHALRPDYNALTPLLKNFGHWLQETYANQKPSNRIVTNLSAGKAGGANRTTLPMLRDLVPKGHVVPVVFAFRHQYLWFTWTGGPQGRLQAQYASHWLPLLPGVNYNALKTAKQEKAARERDESALEAPSPTIITHEQAKARNAQGPL